MTQTCHTGVIWGTVGSLTPGSLLCLTRVVAQSEPGGWSDSIALPGTPLLGTVDSADVSGRRPSKFGPPGGN